MNRIADLRNMLARNQFSKVIDEDEEDEFVHFQLEPKADEDGLIDSDQVAYHNNFLLNMNKNKRSWIQKPSKANSK